jgi:hypothetical protein
MANGYVGKDIPLKKHDMTRQKSNLELYMENGMPCGDIGADGGDFGSDMGKGNVVGGEPMGIHNKFANGIPNEGREDISAERMLPEHKANVDKSVFDSIGDDETDDKAADASEIEPVNMGVHNTFGIK